MAEFKKTFNNDWIETKVIVSWEHSPWIVEIIYCWHKDWGGRVVGYWDKVKSDWENIAEFRSCGSRIMEEDWEDGLLIEILRFWQKLADVVLEIDEVYNKKTS